MTPAPQGPRAPYSEQFRETYREGVSSAFMAGGTAEKYHAMVRYDKEQETTQAVEQHLNQMLPLVWRYGRALDVALARLGVNDIDELLSDFEEPATAEIPVVPGELYVPENWTR